MTKIVDERRQAQHESLDYYSDRHGRDHSISRYATIVIRYDKVIDGQRQAQHKSLYNDSDKV